MDAGACDNAVGGDEEGVVMDAGACDEAEGGDEEGVVADADACDKVVGATRQVQSWMPVLVTKPSVPMTVPRTVLSNSIL